MAVGGSARSRDAEYTEYAVATLAPLRKLAAVLCGDWQRAGTGAACAPATPASGEVRARHVPLRS